VDAAIAWILRLRGVPAKQHLFALRAGQSVIVDAVHLHPEERKLIEAVAAEVDVPFIGLWLEAPEPVLIDRDGSLEAPPGVLRIATLAELPALSA